MFQSLERKKKVITSNSLAYKCYLNQELCKLYKTTELAKDENKHSEEQKKERKNNCRGTRGIFR